MPLIQFWCLPETEESKLNALHQDTVQAITSITELGITSEKQITCLFPRDMMKYGLGTEIIVEVVGLFDKPDRTDEVRQRLAEAIGEVVRKHFPDTELIECLVHPPFNPRRGFWQHENRKKP